jgi:hypothetical protein
MGFIVTGCKSGPVVLQAPKLNSTSTPPIVVTRVGMQFAMNPIAKGVFAFAGTGELIFERSIGGAEANPADGSMRTAMRCSVPAETWLIAPDVAVIYRALSDRVRKWIPPKSPVAGADKAVYSLTATFFQLDGAVVKPLETGRVDPFDGTYRPNPGASMADTGGPKVAMVVNERGMGFALPMSPEAFPKEAMMQIRLIREGSDRDGFCREIFNHGFVLEK